MVIISHRSSTLTNCDQIFALKNRNIERLDVNNSVSVAKEEKI